LCVSLGERQRRTTPLLTVQILMPAPRDSHRQKFSLFPFERSVHILLGSLIGESVRHMAGTAAIGSRRLQRLTLAVLFAVLVFVSKIFLPTPLDKMFVVVQALFLGLGAIALSPFGATVVSGIAGLLTSAWRAPFAPLTLGFAVLYGLLVDAFLILLKVKAENGAVRLKRLVAGLTMATAVTGMISYYATVHVLSLLPRNIVLEAAILVIGVLNGLAGGYLAGLLWSKALRPLLS